MRTQSDHLVRGGALRGSLDTVFTAPLLTRLGRALGTHCLRSDRGRCRFVLSRAEDARLAPLQLALSQGLILSGHDVTDVGERAAPPSTAPHPSARLVIEHGEGTLLLDLGGGPVSEAELLTICEILDAGAFAIGEGTLERAHRVPPARVTP